MSDRRFAVIHFTDGTKLTLDLPKQSDETNIARRMQKILDSSCLTIEADGSLITIPMSSIKYIQSYPSPDVLPDFVIQGATITD